MRTRSTRGGRGSTTSRSCRPDRAALDAWRDRLTGLGIETGEVVDTHYGSGLAFKDPDGLALEIFSAAG